MRNYRRKRQSSGKLKKIMFRIVFVLVAALIITAATVVLGHYLQKKVDDAGGLGEETDSLGGEIQREEIDTSELGYNSETVFACGVDLTAYTDRTELENKIIELSAYYDTLNIPVTDENGNFIYTSPALCELLRLPVSENNTAYELITASIKSAKAVGMKTCIIMAPSDYANESSIIVDAALAGELISLGADEILFTPEITSGDYINYNLAIEISSYFRSIREEIGDGANIGIILPASAYEKASNIKQLQMLASVSTFLAIEFRAEEDETSDDVYKKISESIPSLADSFLTYNLRLVLCYSDENLLGAAYTAAINNSINNISFTSSVIPTSLSYSSTGEASDEAASEAETDSIEDRTNPYAEVPRDETETEGESATEKPWY